MDESELSPEVVVRFLHDRFESVTDVQLLRGGMWSTAFGFESAAGPLVIRFGQHAEDYAKDAFAAGWARPGRPIPVVLEVGEAFDGVFAVSERMYGDKLDELPPERIGPAVDHLIDTLVDLQDITLPGTGYGGWEAPNGDAPHSSWHDFLTAVPDQDDPRLDGWRPALAARPEQQGVFDRAQSKLEQLVVHCGDRRRIVHGDLLAGNVLVSHDNRVSAMFDWANSLAGDPFYDLAWLMFWSPWHPGIDPPLVATAAARFGADQLEHVDEWLCCYQLHVALQGMQYQAFAGLDADLRATAAHTRRLLNTL